MLSTRCWKTIHFYSELEAWVFPSMKMEWNGLRRLLSSWLRTGIFDWSWIVQIFIRLVSLEDMIVMCFMSLGDIVVMWAQVQQRPETLVVFSLSVNRRHRRRLCFSQLHSRVWCSVLEYVGVSEEMETCDAIYTLFAWSSYPSGKEWNTHL